MLSFQLYSTPYLDVEVTEGGIYHHLAVVRVQVDQLLVCKEKHRVYSTTRSGERAGTYLGSRQNRQSVWVFLQ